MQIYSLLKDKTQIKHYISHIYTHTLEKIMLLTSLGSSIHPRIQLKIKFPILYTTISANRIKAQ